TGPAGRPLQQASQHVGPDRDEHAHPGQAGSRAVGQRGPERARAKHRQDGRSADAAQLVTAVSRRPQEPGADTRLKAFNLLKVTHQPPLYTGVTPQDGRSLAGAGNPATVTRAGPASFCDPGWPWRPRGEKIRVLLITQATRTHSSARRAKSPDCRSRS